tara:strand:+ start:108 stop:1160 length:1053 start_codon:yes stop_codon:yes gene_type:complete
MKKISKLLVGILFSALVIAPSYAGEMTVTGGATATFATNGSDASAGQNIGISNELDFTASGELDNGYTWKYQVQLDGDSAANDDTRLEVGTDYGTVGFYVSEGGLSSELAYGIGALGVGFDYASPSTFQKGYDVDGYSNIQYHTPSGLLPFGLGVKLGYVPNMSATTMLSAKNSDSTITSQAEGRSLSMAQVKAAPIDGLSIQGSVAETSSEGGDANGDDGISANVGAKYTMGQFSIGYGEGGYQPATGLTANDETIYYENQYQGIQFDVNDSLSLSYNEDTSEKNTRTGVVVGSTKGTKATVEMEQETIQVAYTVGGATIGIADIEVTNADYTSGKDETQTIISLGISF